MRGMRAGRLGQANYLRLIAIYRDEVPSAFYGLGTDGRS
jgi:hypothetical protein